MKEDVKVVNASKHLTAAREILTKLINQLNNPEVFDPEVDETLDELYAECSSLTKEVNAQLALLQKNGPYHHIYWAQDKNGHTVLKEVVPEKRCPVCEQYYYFIEKDGLCKACHARSLKNAL